MAGIKLLIDGVERSGKTTLTSKVKDALVISFDTKKYPFKVPHVNVSEYTGMLDLTNLISEKIATYEQKFGAFPKTIIFDTVTQFYTMLTKWALDRYNGFDVHSNINKDTMALNYFIENTLVANDANVVIVAHTQFDAKSDRWIIPATGSFANSGSWLSVVDEAVYVGIKANKFFAYHKELKFPCRSTLEDMPVFEPVESYDINAHIAKLEEASSENDEYAI